MKRTLRNIRLEKKLTQAELAKRIDVSKDLIYSFESNRRKPSFFVLMKLCKALDIECSQIEELFETDAE